MRSCCGAWPWRCSPSAHPGSSGWREWSSRRNRRTGTMIVSYPDKVLVAGATRGVGALVVRRLTWLNVPFRILARDRARAGRLGDVEIVEGDALNREDCRRAVAGCAAVVCTLGERSVPRGRATVDGDGIINLIAASVDAGVRRLVLVSSLGVG